MVKDRILRLLSRVFPEDEEAARRKTEQTEQRIDERTEARIRMQAEAGVTIEPGPSSEREWMDSMGLRHASPRVSRNPRDPDREGGE